MPTPLNPAAQPFVFAAPSPPSLADLSLKDPPAGSWSRLPAKIKERIAEHVLDIVAEQEIPQGMYSRLPVTVGWSARKEISVQEDNMSPVHRNEQFKRLCSVDRELRDICEAFGRRSLSFPWFDNADLERLERTFPLDASNVRVVVFDSGRVKPVCGSLIEHPDARARNKVASRLFRMCANVEQVAIHEPRQQPDGVFPLEHLRVAAVTTLSYDARDFAFLQRQPHLESLSVQSRAPPLASESVKLAESLSRFAHLKNLHIKGTRLVSTGFLERAVAIPSPLEGIELVSAEADISFAALAAFLVKFSATLVSLDLNLGDWSSPDLWTVDDGTSLELPRLTTLGVGTDFESTFFLRLLSPTMPLSFFRLDFFPSISKDPHDLLAFLHAHAATLERVFLSREALDGTDHWGEFHRGAKLDDEVVGAIFLQCQELDIEFLLDAERSGGSSAAEFEGEGEGGLFEHFFPGESLSAEEGADVQQMAREDAPLWDAAFEQGPAAVEKLLFDSLLDAGVDVKFVKITEWDTLRSDRRRRRL
ncbi:hypothetical protein JCM8208_000087 [Rhodotorula glutinis]